MISIAPAILANDPETFNRQMESAARYATRVHVDLADGVFTGNALLGLTDIWWPGGMWADLHIMFQRPFDHLESIAALEPHMIIVHAEADGDFLKAKRILSELGIQLGVALLASTPVETIIPALGQIDHVLIFSGDLGHFGGKADLSLLDKARQIKQLRPAVEIGWDGGVNDEVAAELVAGGVEVLNAGGYLNGENPEAAYAKLLQAVGQRPLKKFYPNS